MTIESVVAALKERPRGTALLVAGDLNTTLSDPENDRRGTEIVAALTEAGLEDCHYNAGAQAAAPLFTGQTHAGGQHLCVPTESCVKATRKGEEEERMDLGGHMETRQQESIHATEDKGPVD